MKTGQGTLLDEKPKTTRMNVSNVNLEDMAY